MSHQTRPVNRGAEYEAEWVGVQVITDPTRRRRRRSGALGDAVVPAIAEYLGRCIVADAEKDSVGGLG